MPSPQDLQPLLDVRQNHLNLVLNESDAIDTKALAFLGTNVAVLLFVAQADLSLTMFWQYIVVYGAFLLSLLLDAVAIWPRSYIGASVDLDKHPEYLTMEKDSLLLQLISDTQYAIKVNSKINQFRGRLTTLSLLLTALGLAIVFAII